MNAGSSTGVFKTEAWQLVHDTSNILVSVPKDTIRIEGLFVK